MTIPAVLFGLLISFLLGTGFHLWKDGGIARLLYYLFLSGSGFWSGHGLSDVIGWDFVHLGPLHLGFAVLGCVAFLSLGYWLSLFRFESNR